MAKIFHTGAFQVFQKEFDGKVTSIYMDDNMNVELEVIEEGGTVTILQSYRGTNR